jgi:hypothetical protein
MEMEAAIECGQCGIEFSSKNNAKDHAVLEFQVDEDGKMQNVKISDHLKLEQ